MKFGYFKRKQREAQRLSQQEVGHALAVSQSTYCNWESDRSASRSRHFAPHINLLKINTAKLLPTLISSHPTSQEAQRLHQELHQYQFLVNLLERDLEPCQQRMKELGELN